MRCMLKASEYTDRLRSISIDSGVEWRKVCFKYRRTWSVLNHFKVSMTGKK